MKQSSAPLESCLRAVLAASADLLFLLDEQMRVVMCSDVLLQQWFPAYNCGALVGRKLTDAMRDSVSAVWLEHIEKALEDVKEADSPIRYRDDVLLSTGRTLTFEVSVEALEDTGSPNKGYLLSLRDITALLESKRAEDLAKVSQSTFLANMTYAIRTPMNHIMGISHLLSNTPNLDHTSRNYIAHLMRASSSLMDTLTNIMRYSNTGEPDFDIVDARYLFADLLEDVAVFGQMRAEEKGLPFILDVDPDLPIAMDGDPDHIKQVIVNLLAHAIQTTAHGHVKLTITQLRTANAVDLVIKISDTGIGIDKDDIPHLFSSYGEAAIRPDLGTGLPLAGSLVHAMGGHIETDSHIGKGTTFTFTLSQGVADSTPFATLYRPEKRLVLLYGENLIIDSLETMLIRLSVPYRRVNKNTVSSAFKNPGRYTHIFYRHRDKSEIHPVLQKSAGDIPYLKTVLIVGISDAERPGGNKQSQVLVEPLLISRVATALSDDTYEAAALNEHVPGKGPFSLQDVRILVVDDSEINAMVASEILRGMSAEADMALSGQEALNLCAQNEYDIIFMDHLMPVMDGMETTARIRALGGTKSNVPIIALTANAVVGIRQFYLTGGMNGFVAKPIDIAALHEVLREFLPPDKILEAEAPDRPSADTDISITEALRDVHDLDPGLSVNKTGAKTYLAILRTFTRVAPEKIKRLREYADNGEWDSFRVEIHGQKSSLLNIGAAPLSARARAMEQLVIQGKTDTIDEKLDIFLRQMKVLCKGIKTALEKSETTNLQKIATTEDKAALTAALWRIAGHLDYLDLEAIEKELAPLLLYNYSEHINSSLQTLKGALDAFDYDQAAEIVQNLQKKEGLEV